MPHRNEIEDRIYNARDFDRTLVLDDRTLVLDDRTLVLDDRTELVAHKVTEFLKESGNRFQKTILF